MLGRGGMGVVYLAFDPRLKRRVALKVLAPELAHDRSFRERFIRESEVAASLDHPNVVPIFEAGEHDGVLYIAMRYVEGTDLGGLLEREGPLDPTRAVALITQVASALDAAHEVGLIHRDVKPGNVLVGKADHAYLTDFGLIRRMSHGTSLTRTGQFMGTIEYVAPEQIRGDAVDGRADVYSLGCLLHECLTGVSPFASDLEVTMLYAHLEEAPPRVTDRRPELPPGIDAVVAKAMAKRAADRYPTAGALAEDAREALAPAPSWVPIPPPTRRIWPFVVAATAVLIAIAVILVLTFGHSRGTLTAAPTATPPSTSPTGSSVPAVPLDSVVQIDPRTGHVERSVDDALRGDVHTNGGNPVLAVGEGAVWAVWGSWVTPVDPESGQHPEPLQFTCGCAGPGVTVALAFQAVWLPGAEGDSGPGIVIRLDPATDQVLRRIHLGRLELQGPQGYSSGLGALWAVFGNGTVLGFDAAGDITHDFDVHKSLDRAVVGFDSLWLLDKLDSLVLRVDPRSDEVTDRIHVTGSLSAIAAGAGGIWVVDGIGGTVVPIDPSINKAGTPIRVGDAPTGIAAGLGAVWVTDEDGNVYRIDPITHDRSTIVVGPSLTAIALDPDSKTLWVTATATA